MRIKALAIYLSLCSQVSAMNADFSTFNQIKSTKPTRKIFKAKVQQHKVNTLKTAIIWHAPPYRYTCKAHVLENKEFFEAQALEIIINAASANNPSFAELIKNTKHDRIKNLISKTLSLGRYGDSRQSNTTLEQQIKQISSKLYKYLDIYYSDTSNKRTSLNRALKYRNELSKFAGELALNHIDNIFSKGAS